MNTTYLIQFFCGKSHAARVMLFLAVSKLIVLFYFFGICHAASGVEKPVYRGGTLRIASLLPDMDAFDPLTGYSTDSWEVLRAVTRQLVTYPGSATDIGDDTTLVPDLAQDWTVSDDGKVYTFHLKDNTFYSGPTTRKIVSNDFVYAIKRFCDPNKQVAAINYFNTAISGFKAYCKNFSKIKTGDLAAVKDFIQGHEISGVQAPDSKTLIIRSDTKNYDFLNILAMNFVSPLPPEIASKYFPDSLEFRKNFPSSGPYYVKSYKDGEALVLRRARKFGADETDIRKAYVDEIIIDFSTNNEDSIVHKIEIGESDLSLYMEVPPRGTIRNFLKTKPSQICSSNSGAATFITINARPELKSEGSVALRKLKVRQALSYALNRHHLAQIQGGPIVAVPLSQIITSTIMGYEAYDPYPTADHRGNALKAKELLDQAGYKSGVKLDAIYRVTPQMEALAVAIKDDFFAAGIDLNLIPVPATQWYALIQDPKSRWDISLSGQFAPDWQGPSTRMLLGGWLDSDASPCGTGNVNAICYVNPELNRLAARAFSSDNPSPIWAKADKIVSADLPWIPLFETRKVVITSNRVTHWEWSSLAVQADITNIMLKN